MGYTYDYQPATKGKYWYLANQNTNGIVIHSIGCPQPKAQVLVNNFNKETASASVHGFIEPGLYIETAPTKVSKRQAKKCYHVGSGTNGSYNSSRIGIEMCEPSTITYTGGASFTDRDPAKTRAYIEGVTATAAEVMADICIFHDFGPEMITTHAEAHKLGYGSNHGDPDHIWKHIGYSIAQFRKDVQRIIDDKKGDVLANMTKQEFEAILDAKFAEFTKTVDDKFVAADKATTEKLTALKKELAPVSYKYITDVPEWARKSVQKALDKKIIIGTGKDKDGKATLDLSVDLTRTLVLLDNAGLFDIESGVLVLETK